MEQSCLRSTWWAAVQSIATLVFDDEIDLDHEQAIKAALYDEGFSKDVVKQALSWLDSVSLQAPVVEVLAMVQPEDESRSMRIAHPMEEAGLPQRIFYDLDACKRKGLFSSDFAERLIESMRMLDTRDWDEEEIDQFFYDLMDVTLDDWTRDGWTRNGFSLRELKRILKGREKDFFC